MRLPVLVLGIAMTATGCAAMKNTPAQGKVILQRIDPDGRVWVELRNGTVGLAEWQQCMAKAREEQAARAKR